MRSWRAGAPEGAAFLCNSADFAESDQRFRSQDIGVSHCASCTDAPSRFPIARQSRRYRDTSAATTLVTTVVFAAVPRSVFNGVERVVRYQRERDHERGGPGSIRAPVSMSSARHWAGTACTADRSPLPCSIFSPSSGLSGLGVARSTKPPGELVLSAVRPLSRRTFLRA